jgi:DNA primase
VNRAIKGNLKKLSMRRREDEVKTDFGVISQSGPKKITGQSNRDKVVSHSDEYQERDVIRILFLYGDKIVDKEKGQTMAEYVIGNISEALDTFTNPLYARIIEHYIKALKEGVIPTHESLISLSDQEISSLVVEFIAPPYEYSANWENKKQMPLTTQAPPDMNYGKDSYQSIVRFMLKKIQRKIGENKALIEKLAAENETEQLKSHLKVHMKLKEAKSKLEIDVNSIGMRL